MREEVRHIGMVAGETSGDLLGGHLIAALRSRRPGLSFSGIGGPRMVEHGFESHYAMDRLAVLGYADALRNYRAISAIRTNLGKRFIAERPALFIGVDAPDFNLGLERTLKEAGIPAVHYVSPSVWAWRGWRVRKIARSVTHMLALFPFEPKIYDKVGVPVTYVGHPLADEIPLEVDKAEARTQLRLPARKLIIALLPGSRRSEMQHMAETFIRTAHRLYEEVKDVHFVCPTVSRETRDMLQDALYRYGGQDLPLTQLFGHSHEALAAADLALVASGTATLEAALLKTPMVITYKVSPVNWLIMRHM
ncbi:MAG: lipid-A-disaccharide synthase, partial [Betaproteobacteria bacterium]|nr:lipid-A-disaccharide synthase [Betaproteobacteria bacterium]